MACAFLPPCPLACSTLRARWHGHRSPTSSLCRKCPDHAAPNVSNRNNNNNNNKPRHTPTASERRPGTEHTDPAFLPQTIEYAIRQAQHATRDALCAGLTHLQVELPMGRSRSHWYAMSPSATWYKEASILAFHYAELFQGLHISLVLGNGPGVTHPVPWISDLRRLEDEPPESAPATSLSEPTSSSPSPAASGQVVIFAGINESQRDLFHSRLEQLEHNSDVKGVILFCSFLETPLSHSFAPFHLTYLCRPFKKLALLRDGHNAPWSVFIEIAVFEYEWVGDREASSNWIPVQETLERFVFSNGAFVKRESAYLATKYCGCEGGFWPFMTICSREVLPLDGVTLEREAEVKKKKARARPFGFF